MKRFKLKISENLGKSLQAILVAIILFASIGLVEKRQEYKVCQKIIIQIQNQYENYFINDKDVMDLLTEGGSLVIKGRELDELNLKQLELKVKEHKFVKDAEVYRDLKGNLIVNIAQNRPLARISQTDGPDAYISQEGDVLPVSDRYTARVVILRGPYVKKLIKDGLNQSNRGLAYLELLSYIEQDKFWKAEIAEIEIDAKGGIIFLPQLGKQKIIFGQPQDIEEKFRKLNIFLKQILPHKGWNHYNTVNLKFKDQIICD
ncbi:MAG: cell division protein FtsQ/DivIB [Candidatus Cyclobacteriaceae bacterium M3_2C_046]